MALRSWSAPRSSTCSRSWCGTRGARSSSGAPPARGTPVAANDGRRFAAVWVGVAGPFWADVQLSRSERAMYIFAASQAESSLSPGLGAPRAGSKPRARRSSTKGGKKSFCGVAISPSARSRYRRSDRLLSYPGRFGCRAVATRWTAGNQCCRKVKNGQPEKRRLFFSYRSGARLTSAIRDL